MIFPTQNPCRAALAITQSCILARKIAIIVRRLREQAKAIYLRDFWQAGQMDQYDGAIAFQVFDFAVNSGIQTAIGKLQAAIGAADDGHWGPASAAALAAMNVNDVLMRFMAQRLRFWVKCSAWSTMGAGWANRAAADLEYASQDN